VTTIELVVTDLDGTLWGADESVHPRTLAALEELARRQVPVMAATGRNRRLARQTLSDHGLIMDTVLHDGALGVTADDLVFHSCPFSSEGTRRVIEVFASFGHEPLFEIDHPDAELVHGEHPSLPRPPRSRTIVCDLSAELPEAAYRAIAAVESDAAQAIIADIAESGAGHAWSGSSGIPDTSWILVRPPECSKWAAVLSYCDLVGVDPTRVLAIGDGNNDIELLANASISLAPDGASPAASEHAHHRVPAASEGGWADLVQFL
jgi:hydroxymethylpyrimidine pyrophosphatase-like HAD family hydrolase